MTSSPPPAPEKLSLRDPAGELVLVDGRVIRLVRADGLANLDIYLDAAALAPFRGSGALIGGRRIQPETAPALRGGGTAAAAVEHDPVPFVSFPYEWPAEMLHEAGRLTLDLAVAGLADGIGLKDAKPDNVTFRGPDPVFIDALSFEARTPGDPLWRAEAQFLRTFVLPLLAERECGLSAPALLATRSDGLAPEELYRMLGPLRRLAPGVFGPVTLAAKLRRAGDDGSIYEPRILPSDDKARFILGRLYARLRRALDRAAPSAGRRSDWSDYMAGESYDADAFAAKEAFVTEAAAQIKPAAALDIGCNTGHFSALLADAGARVVATDMDPVVVGETWRRARAHALDILPLVQNMALPSPATGWRNRERASFLDRARGGFDMVVMLAVVHHMMVGDGIPLDEIIDLAADLTRDAAVIEFISADDPMFRRLLRGRDDLYAWYGRDAFERACRLRFEIDRHRELAGGKRVLYLLRRKSA